MTSFPSSYIPSHSHPLFSPSDRAVLYCEQSEWPRHCEKLWIFGQLDRQFRKRRMSCWPCAPHLWSRHQARVGRWSIPTLISHFPSPSPPSPFLHFPINLRASFFLFLLVDWIFIFILDFLLCTVSSRAVLVDREHQWHSQVHRLSLYEFKCWSLLRQSPLRFYRYFFVILNSKQTSSFSSNPLSSSSHPFVISEIGRNRDECHWLQRSYCGWVLRWQPIILLRFVLHDWPTELVLHRYFFSSVHVFLVITS